MRYIILSLILSCTLAGQTRIVVTKKTGPPPPEKQPGDSVELDPVTQEIVAVSKGMTIRLPLENLIEPALAAQVVRTGQVFTYTYSIANGARATQAIMSFSFECQYPEYVELKAPTEWYGRKIPPEVNHFRSLAFSQSGDDDQVKQNLTRGKGAGPFQMTSRLTPGLIRAVVYALPLERPSTELPKGEKLRFLSPWAYQKVLEFDSNDRRLKYVLTVGPKTPPDQDSLSAIRMELAYASGQPEFAAISAQLGSLARISTKEQLQSQLKGMARDALQANFVQALLWRLEAIKE